MLGNEATGRAEVALTDKLAQVMAVNKLSAEMMLARFFDAEVLREYLARRSMPEKGSAATLAARIAKEWSRPDFGEASQEDKATDASSAPTAWKEPTWLELQTDSDDDEEEAQRKKRLKEEARQVKRRRLDAAETAGALSRAAYEAEAEDEAPVAFNKEHYGADGLNGRFEAADAIAFFAGSEDGGGGLFEDSEARDIARNGAALVDVMRRYGLCEGATCIDVGAGTGLMLSPLSRAVGDGGRVFAIDISTKFVDFLRKRAPREGLANVTVSRCSGKATGLEAGTASFACLLDVYHHLEYPVTFMRSLRDTLCDGGKVRGGRCILFTNACADQCMRLTQR